MQPIEKDSQGIVRFKRNAIVRTLLDESRERGFGLNELSLRDFPQADWEQFFQLIGYSLSGYHELSQVSDSSALEASAAARRVVGDARGCRDEYCPIHCGVKKERGIVDRSDTVLKVALSLAAFVVAIAVLVEFLTGCGPAFRAADSIELPDSSALPAVDNSPMLEADVPLKPAAEASQPDTGAGVSEPVDAGADVWMAEGSSSDVGGIDDAASEPVLSDAPLCWSHNGSTCPPGAYIIDLPDAIAPPSDPTVACYPNTTECPLSQWGSRWICCRGACNVACGGPDAAVVACCECFRPGVSCALPTDCCLGFTCVGGVCQ